jgi:nucleoside-diphosphate-sugar epimerase
MKSERAATEKSAAAKTVFLAGASGAIGKRLVPQLIAAGYAVVGTTRSSTKALELKQLGATSVVLDVFNYADLARAVSEARPEVVMHQLTDLPKTLAGTPSEEILKANSRLRDQGTRNLIDAAISAGARRFIAQSIAWVYAPGPEPHEEDDRLNIDALGSTAITVGGVLALERLTLHSPPLEGIVLRYGQLYGPGTRHTARNGPVPVHVDAAARAALLAIETTHLGTFNIAEEKGLVSAERARRELDWSADFRLRGP